MCEHDYKIIKTTGQDFTKRCTKCGDLVVELKEVKKAKWYERFKK